MDTSVDISTITGDFLAQYGVNLPSPTPRQYAERLFATLSRLEDSGVLKRLIGNNPIDNIHELSVTIDQMAPEDRAPFQDLRIRKVNHPIWNVRSLFRHQDTDFFVYLGYRRQYAYWLLYTSRYLQRMKIHESNLSILDVTTMAEVLSLHDSYNSRVSCAELLMQELHQMLSDSTRELEEETRNAQRHVTLLEVDLSIIRSASETPSLGTGTGFED